MKLTKRIIDQAAANLAAGNRDRQLLWDGEISGFGVRLTRKGGAYFLNYRNEANIERRITLGTLAELTIDAARRKAAEMKVSIRAGSDPLGEIRAKAAVQKPAKAMTMTELSQKFLAAGEADWSKHTHRGYKCCFNKHILPVLGHLPAAEITKAEIAEAIAAIRKISPSMAAMSLRTLSSCLGWGEEMNLLEEARVPRAKRVAPPVPPRKRTPSDEEVKRMWSATFKLAPGDAGAARLIILTVLRTDTVNQLQADWLEGNKLLIPGTAMKNKLPHQVPLATWAMPLVAPSWEDPRQATRHILPEIRRLAKIPDVDFHDLRRSFRTWCGKAGINGDHAEFALAHISHQSRLEKTYDTHQYTEEACQALLAWQEHIRHLVFANA